MTISNDEYDKYDKYNDEMIIIIQEYIFITQIYTNIVHWNLA